MYQTDADNSQSSSASGIVTLSSVDSVHSPSLTAVATATSLIGTSVSSPAGADSVASSSQTRAPPLTATPSLTGLADKGSSHSLSEEARPSCSSITGVASCSSHSGPSICSTIASLIYKLSYYTEGLSPRSVIVVKLGSYSSSSNTDVS